MPNEVAIQPDTPKPEPHWADMPMSAEARAYYENTFLVQYMESLEKVKQVPLGILIWGPGTSGDKLLYNKRLQILETLRGKKLPAFFSEEVEKDCPSSDLPIDARELLQAASADFIVILQGSPGSTADVHDFWNLVQDIGRKMLIFIASGAESGYSYRGALSNLKTLYNNVETYKYPNDVTECNLLRSVEEKIRVLQWTKFRATFK